MSDLLSALATLGFIVLLYHVWYELEMLFKNRKESKKENKNEE